MTKVKCGFGYCKYYKKGICQAKEIQINVCHDGYKNAPLTEEEYFEKILLEDKKNYNPVKPPGGTNVPT
jgi:hypothetical protein